MCTIWTPVWRYIKNLKMLSFFDQLIPYFMEFLPTKEFEISTMVQVFILSLLVMVLIIR